MSIRETLKNSRLTRWIDTGEVPLAEVATDVAAGVAKAVKKRPEPEEKDLVLIQDAQALRGTVGEAVKGGVMTGVGLTVCAAGLGRMLLSPNGIVGMGLAIGGGAVTVLFGGKTLKDFWHVNRKLRK